MFEKIIREWNLMWQRKTIQNKLAILVICKIWKKGSNILKFNLEVPWFISYHWFLSIPPKVIRKPEIYVYFSWDQILPRCPEYKFSKITFVWTNPSDAFWGAYRLSFIWSLYLNISYTWSSFNNKKLMASSFLNSITLMTLG